VLCGCIYFSISAIITDYTLSHPVILKYHCNISISSNYCLLSPKSLLYRKKTNMAENNSNIEANQRKTAIFASNHP